MFKKRLLALLLAVSMLIIAFPATVAFALTEGDYEYELINNNAEVRITKYVGAGGDVYIPNKIDGKFVTEIGQSAFNGNTNITYVWMSDKVTVIGRYAFENCTSLTSLDLGNGLKTIERTAFQNCDSLVSVVIPDSVETINSRYDDEGAFAYCDSLKSITIGNGLKAIASYSFRDCPKLESVTIGNSVESIGDSAFNSCTSLKSIIIPDSTISIGNSAFENCTSLTSLDLGNGLKTIEKSAFQNCDSLVSVVIPDSVETINSRYDDEGAFAYCDSLKSITIGNGLKAIASYSFRDCPKLESVIIGNSVESIGESAFNSCTSLKSIIIPDSTISIGRYAFENCTSLTSLDLGNGLKTIEKSAFKNCDSLVSVVIPDSVEAINSNDWYDDGAFAYCDNLKSITIGNGLKTIASYSFRDCPKLESVTIGNSVESIGESAFGGCDNLKNIYYLGNAPEISEENESLNTAVSKKLPSADGFSLSTSVSSTYITVTVNANGGESALSDDNVVEIYTKHADNGRVSAPIIPTREGYTFEGWYLNSSFTGKSFNFSTDTVTGDITLFAKWSKNTYRVFYDPRGGSVSSGGKYVAYGDAIGTLPTPTLAGDTFDGWYLGLNSSGPMYTASTKMPAKDIILYAGWQNNDSATTVIFDTQGGNFIKPVNISGNSTALKPEDPIREGYEFIGWYADNTHYTKYTFTETVTENTTVYAAWKKKITNITSSVYSIEGENILGIREETSSQSFLSMLNQPENCKVYSSTGALLGAEDTITTGCTVTLYEGSVALHTLTIVIMGDVSKDGKINSTDFTQVRRQYLELYSMNDTQKVAADVTYDGKINSTDFMQIRKHFLGLFNLFE